MTHHPDIHLRVSESPGSLYSEVQRVAHSMSAHGCPPQEVRELWSRSRVPIAANDKNALFSLLQEYVTLSFIKKHQSKNPIQDTATGLSK
jgi:hypothetical protein